MNGIAQIVKLQALLVTKVVFVLTKIMNAMAYGIVLIKKTKILIVDHAMQHNGHVQAQDDALI